MGLFYLKKNNKKIIVVVFGHENPIKAQIILSGYYKYYI